MVLFSAIAVNLRFGTVKHLSSCGTLFSPVSSNKDNVGRLPRGYGAVNAYNLFTKDQYQEGQKIPDVGKRAAQLWKDLPDSQKKKLEQESTKITQQRRSDFLKLPLKNRVELKQQSALRLSRSRLRTYNKKVDELGKPKQPPSAYALYMKGVLKNATSREVGSEEMRKGAVVWNSMSAQEKAGYVAEAEELSKAYVSDMEKWVAGLTEKGIAVPVRPTKRSMSSPARKAAKKVSSRRASSKTHSRSIVRAKSAPARPKKLVAATTAKKAKTMTATTAKKSVGRPKGAATAAKKK